MNVIGTEHFWKRVARVPGVDRSVTTSESVKAHGAITSFVLTWLPRNPTLV